MSEHTLNIDTLIREAIDLLQALIRVPSFSGEENESSRIIDQYLQKYDIQTHKKGNNVWARNAYFHSGLPTLLLNSHLDTVRPNKGWTRDPFEPMVEDGTLYGLGSNDAGGPLVSLIATFLFYYDNEDLPYNLVLAATAEEETSGPNGISSILPDLPPLDLAIVGEPSGMTITVAERGHIVLEVTARGRSGHAARDEGINAINKALEDIRWFQTYEFPRESDLLGAVKMSITMIQGGIQANVIPDTCTFVVDIRVPDVYTNEEILEVIREHVVGEVREVSRSLKSSRLPDDHPLIHAARGTGLEFTASPTSSDQGLLDVASIKIGPGESERSHTADEFIRLSEIDRGIREFIRLLEHLDTLL